MKGFYETHRWKKFLQSSFRLTQPSAVQTSPCSFLSAPVPSSPAFEQPVVTKPETRYSGVVDVEFGKNVIVVQPVNLYGCAIGDGSFIGPFVEIQKAAKIGKRCRVQSHSFICELVTIGDDCFISHGAMFINDPFVTGGPATERGLWRQTKLGNRVSIGTNATILPVTICDGAVIGAGTVVTKDIKEPGIYVGNPARLLRRLPATP
jgi:acetyltransferase-like isoleucine patch superfamily enzyme